MRVNSTVGQSSRACSQKEIPPLVGQGADIHWNREYCGELVAGSYQAE